MKDEFEVISHGAADYKVFVVNLLYRTPHIHKDFEICLLLEGSVRLLSRGREELLEYLSRPEVEYREDGTVWVHWLGQSLDITNQFEDGVCYVKLDNGGETLYLTVEYGGGYTASPHRYVKP